MEKFLPLSFPGGGERLRCGKTQDETPCRRCRPVLEGFQRRGIIFAQGGLELIDERSALTDEFHFIGAEQAQFRDHGIVRRERLPAVAVHAQSIGQAPGIELVVLHAGGRFAAPIALGSFGHHGINREARVEKLLDGHAVRGLDGHGERPARAKALEGAVPAGVRVIETEAFEACALAVDDDNIVVIAGPVESGEGSEFVERCHWMSAWCGFPLPCLILASL